MESVNAAEPHAQKRNRAGRGVALDSSGPRYPGLVALLLIWSAVGAVTSARHYFGPFSKPTAELAVFFACVAYFYPWTVLSPLAFRLERRSPLGGAGWVRNLAVLAAWSFPISLAAVPAMWGVTLLVHLAFGDPVSWPPVLYLVVGTWPVAQASFWSSVAGGYVIRTRHELQEQERRSARLAVEKSELEAGLNQAQLEVLRARLNPHFLFNSLQNISVMIGQDPSTASRMVTQLGDLLRAVLRQDSQPETTLDAEVGLTRTYVAIEQMRFGDRLRVAFDIAPAASAALVPSFLLQPLIENAVVHGLRGVRKTGVITVSAAASGDDLAITVADNGIGPRPRRGPTSRSAWASARPANVWRGCTRDRHTFSMRRPAEGGTEVRITLPFRVAAPEGRFEHHEQPAPAGR